MIIIVVISNNNINNNSNNNNNNNNNNEINIRLTSELFCSQVAVKTYLEMIYLVLDKSFNAISKVHLYPGRQNLEGETFIKKQSCFSTIVEHGQVSFQILH